MSAPVNVAGAAGERLGERVGHLVARGDEAVDRAAGAGRPRRSRTRPGRRCGSCRRSTTPPRAPISRPAARASSSRGRMPAEKTRTPTSSGSRPLRCSCATRPRSSAVIFSVVRAEVHAHPEGLDVADQHGAAALVALQRHRPRRHLDDVGLEPQVQQGVRGLQAEQPAADDDTGARVGGRCADRLEVGDRAVDEAVRRPRGPAPAARTGTTRWRGRARRSARRGRPRG